MASSVATFMLTVIGTGLCAARSNSCVVVSNPSCVTSMRKCPGGSPGRSKWPFSSVQLTQACPPAVSISRSVAPGTGTPSAVWTIPVASATGAGIVCAAASCPTTRCGASSTGSRETTIQQIPATFLLSKTFPNPLTRRVDDLSVASGLNASPGGGGAANCGSRVPLHFVSGLDAPTTGKVTRSLAG